MESVGNSVLPDGPARLPAHRPLWLCVRLPMLPLEVLGLTRSGPQAVLAGAGGQTRLLVCNPVAMAHGVRVGMTVNAALALCPCLGLHERTLRLERQALERLADLAGEFTPVVSVQEPDALLLEVAGSLGLFGGIDSLLVRLSAALDERGHAVTVAGSPTPRAAVWLARAGRESVIRERAHLALRLSDLPMSALGWPAAMVDRLAQMGVRSLGQCVRLPRQGLARRLGPEYLRELDEAYGRRPELLRLHEPACRYHDELELPGEVLDFAGLQPFLEALLERLGRHLGDSQRSVQHLSLYLRHDSRQLATLAVRPGRPGGDVRLLADILRLRLDALRLELAVTSLAISVELGADHATAGRDLLGHRLDVSADLAALVERLRARLGAQAVHGLAVVAEHRPESSWAVTLELPVTGRAVQGTVPADGHWPVWLLRRPQPLRLVAGRPVYAGNLVLEGGPERIETGWWDGGDVRRDYYRARNHRGMRLWVFRDLRESAWFLHGLYG